MPYKDAEIQKEAAKERQRKHRQGVTLEGVTRKERIEFIRKELSDPYLINNIELAALKMGDRDIRYERAYRYKLWKEGRRPSDVDKGTAAKLLLTCNALDKEAIGLDGKKVNLLTMVRYGISGPTMKEVKVSLT